VAKYEVLIHEPIGSCQWLKTGKFERKSEVKVFFRLQISRLSSMVVEARLSGVCSAPEEEGIECYEHSVIHLYYLVGSKYVVRIGSKLAVVDTLYVRNGKAAISDCRENIQVPSHNDAVKNHRGGNGQ